MMVIFEPSLWRACLELIELFIDSFGNRILQPSCSHHGQLHVFESLSSWVLGNVTEVVGPYKANKNQWLSKRVALVKQNESNAA